MADPFVAEIRIFPFNFAPKGWAFCAGQIMPISQNTALFSLLGTTYGGDGKSTFALPNLQDSAPLHPGQGQGLSLYDLGQEGGTDFVTLLQSEIPAHTHNLTAHGADTADNSTPGPALVYAKSHNGNAYSAVASNVNMHPQYLSIAGGSLPHNNLMPYLTLSFCIALQGIFPPRP
jgi:microcystin-dependent protein